MRLYLAELNKNQISIVLGRFQGSEFVGFISFYKSKKRLIFTKVNIRILFPRWIVTNNLL
ncbi:MAG: hypothetical protein LBD63_03305 [Mycoplasmataceae bacterium]|nr:hypothetical protein [Mycoplasmataceae bacterium]